jgi:DNA-binding HxlR family transcriptional regulator
MKDELDPREIILQRYVIDILRELKTPKRYGELQAKIRTRRTLSTKLFKLKKYGLINVVPILIGNRYVSSYSITNKGKKIINLLEKM